MVTRASFSPLLENSSLEDPPSRPKGLEKRDLGEHLKSAGEAQGGEEGGFPVSYRSSLSMGSTAGTEGEGGQRLGFPGDLNSSEFGGRAYLLPSDTVFPTSQPSLKQKLYSETGLKARGGETVPEAFERLQEADVDRVRTNVYELEELLNSLDEKFEPICLRECSRPCRVLKSMASPCASSLLQRRATNISE